MKIIFALLLALLLPVAASAHGLTETRKIEMLISSVEQLPGAVFIRNGSDHTSAEAASHMRMKWKYAGRRIHTARDFIRFCASESTLTHQKYQMRLANGTTVESGKWLTERLQQIELHPAVTAAPTPAGAAPRR